MSGDQVKKIGLFGASAIVAGNMMGSGIALLPSNLASIGSISIFGWLIAGAGALALALVYARLGTENPQAGGPVAYAGEVSPILGYQTGILYFHANWIGNLAIALTGVAYLSVFFPALTHPVAGALATIAMIWLFTGLNLLGANWIGRLVTIGVILLLIPVVLTGTYGWLFFESSQFSANWIVGGSSSSQAVMAAVLLCIWSFIGVESSSVSSGVVKNPRKNVPRSTIIGASVAALVYILSCSAISGMFPASQLAASGAPFSLAAGHMFGSWAPGIVSAIVAFACLCSLGSWMMLVSQAGARAAKDGTLPGIFGKLNGKGIPAACLVLSSIFMTVLMVTLLVVTKGENTQDLFGDIADIAVLLTLPAYLYSSLDLIRLHGFRDKRAIIPMTASLLACAFCFVALAGATRVYLTVAIVVMLGVFIFYAGKDRSEYRKRIMDKRYTRSR
ncbi:MAG: cadaverine/lysine antiporter [Candidatus Aegiribacteria sp.]|nr:cadaverine/lysine antiporter [Candidatus Aegiribacteria sp.]MBD3295671.1 cadaverine/lysine antiporter [Candidatus Fermentibacteria bacterium]